MDASAEAVGRRDRMTEELKRCPFCGGKAILKKIPNTKITPYYVRCNSKKCMMHVATCNRNDPEEAIAIWNRREGGQDG